MLHAAWKWSYHRDHKNAFERCLAVFWYFAVVGLYKKSMAREFLCFSLPASFFFKFNQSLLLVSPNEDSMGIMGLFHFYFGWNLRNLSAESSSLVSTSLAYSGNDEDSKDSGIISLFFWLESSETSRRIRRARRRPQRENINGYFFYFFVMVMAISHGCTKST